MKRIVGLVAFVLFLMLGIYAPAFAQQSVNPQNGYPNDTSTGTTVNRLVKLTGAGKAIIATTSDTVYTPIGIAIAGAGTSGSVTVQNLGLVKCDFDGATTQLDFVSISAGTNGKCTDAGATRPVDGDLGIVLSTNGGSGTYWIFFRREGVLGGNVTTKTTGDASSAVASTNFVAQAIAGLNPAQSVNAATTGALANSPTYANGSAGVGATLTEGSNAALTVDGYTPSVNDRILVKNQASTLQNGVYSVTATGDGSNPYVLTRATDYNTAANIDATGVVPVINGTANATTSWLLTTSPVTTIGTDSLVYAQFTSAPGGGTTGGKGTVPINTYSITGASPVLQVGSPSKPAFDFNNLPLTANASIAMPAKTKVADGEVVVIKAVQPSGHAYTLTLTVDGGATTTLVYTSGCPAAPNMPTGANNELMIDLHFKGPLNEWQVMGCVQIPGGVGTATIITAAPLSGDGSPGNPVTASVPYAISAGNETYGSNSLYATGQQIGAWKAAIPCHFTNLTCINTFHAATCTTAPTVNVFDGASTTGTAQQCSNALQSTRGTVTAAAQSLAIGASHVYGIYISTQGGTCLTDQFTVTADITCP